MKENPTAQVETGQAQVISNPFPDTTSHNIVTASQRDDEDVRQSTSTPAPDSPTSPSGAADNDLIEKTWIVAVDNIAREHGDDPFVLQQKQAELTRDYLLKRFGREIKAS